MKVGAAEGAVFSGAGQHPQQGSLQQGMQAARAGALGMSMRVCESMCIGHLL